MAKLEHAEDDPQHVKMSSEISASSFEVKPAAESSTPSRDGGALSCALPSFSAAAELLSAPYSCLVMNTHRRHIALPPMYLSKKRTGIQEELEGELLKFSQSLKGVPLAYENISILGHHGSIYDDNGYIHMNIEGNVNKLGVSHVGCLVHGCFNASIPRPNLVSVETWRDAGPRIGAELEFEVTALDADMMGVLLIRGRLNRTRVQELLAMAESSESGVPADQPEPEPEPMEESPEGTPKKKKKKKDKVKQEEREEEMTTPSCQDTTAELNGTMNDKNGHEAGEKKKKKKKKHMKEEEVEVELARMEVNGSDSSGYLSDKPSTKRKLETDTDVPSSLSEEAPKSKRKRKSNIA
ncbi:DNA-directed RNA polymerase I subunit RPA43 [Dissostichus eleginoides]|uniref:DNA-directed RNA polymerase subunit n=1 Tax=Dissostichus eleginoides TaxID=100907 RepID=A0AAD9BC16_DISEL|nr:DNA-directed RNA polymerase I subunit RPA43 [Dissostichus eleginoides]